MNKVRLDADDPKEIDIRYVQPEKIRGRQFLPGYREGYEKGYKEGYYKCLEVARHEITMAYLSRPVEIRIQADNPKRKTCDSCDRYGAECERGSRGQEACNKIWISY